MWGGKRSKPHRCEGKGISTRLEWLGKEEDSEALVFLACSACSFLSDGTLPLPQSLTTGQGPLLWRGVIGLYRGCWFTCWALVASAYCVSAHFI